MLHVSIIIPMYNVSLFITSCLQSVIDQTYSAIECIIIDDSSSDDSLQKARNMVSAYKGQITFSIISLLENAGVSAARNTGIKHATGDYLLFLDSDDQLPPDSVENLVRLAVKYPGVQMVQGNADIIPRPEIHTEMVSISRKEFPEFLEGKGCIWPFFSTGPNYEIPFTAWNKLILTEFVLENNLYFTEGIIYEDILWLFQAQLKLYSVAFSFPVSYNYITRPNSIMTSGISTRSVLSWSFVLDYIFENSGGTLSPNQRKRFLEIWRDNINSIKKINTDLLRKTLYTKSKNTLNLYIRTGNAPDLQAYILARCILVVPSFVYRKTFFRKKVLHRLVRILTSVAS